MGLGMDWMDRMAFEQINELLSDPARQAALKYFEQVDRNPAWKVLYKQLEEQARSPLFQVSKQKMREFGELTAHEQLRTWERHIPDWILETKAASQSRSGCCIRKLASDRTSQSESVWCRWGRATNRGFQPPQLGSLPAA